MNAFWFGTFVMLFWNTKKFIYLPNNIWHFFSPLVDAMQAYAPSSVNNPLYGDIMTATQLSMGKGPLN